MSGALCHEGTNWQLFTKKTPYRDSLSLKIIPGDLEKLLRMIWSCAGKCVSRAETSYGIPQYLWYVITCPCPWCPIPRAQVFIWYSYEYKSSKGTLVRWWKDKVFHVKCQYSNFTMLTPWLINSYIWLELMILIKRFQEVVLTFWYLRHIHTRTHTHTHTHTNTRMYKLKSDK